MPAPAVFPTVRDNHGSRNRSIAIAKLITKFHGEGDPITYVERFEQICAVFRDVSDGDKIGAFGIQLDGKAGAWYRALKDEEKDTWETLRGSFILKYSPKGLNWSPVNQLNQVKQGKDSESAIEKHSSSRYPRECALVPKERHGMVQCMFRESSLKQVPKVESETTSLVVQTL